MVAPEMRSLTAAKLWLENKLTITRASGSVAEYDFKMRMEAPGQIGKPAVF